MGDAMTKRAANMADDVLRWALPLAAIATLASLAIALTFGVPKTWVGGSCPDDFKYVGSGRCEPACERALVGSEDYCGVFMDVAILIGGLHGHRPPP